MIYLLCIIIPYLLGRGALRALYGKCGTHDITRADGVLTGGIIVIGLAEAAHVGAVVLGRSFSDAVTLFLVGLVGLLVVAAVLIIIESRRKKMDAVAVREAERQRIRKIMTAKTHQGEEQIIYAVFGAIVLIQVLLVVSGQKVYPAGDMTV